MTPSPDTHPGGGRDDGPRTDRDRAELRDLLDAMSRESAPMSRRRDRRGRLETEADFARREQESRRRSRMEAEAARREAYHQATLSRMRETDGDSVSPLSIARERRDDDVTIFQATIDREGEDPISLQKAIDIEGIDIELGNKPPGRGEVRLSSYPDTPLKRLEMIRQLLTAKAEKTVSGERTDNEKAIARSEEARRGVENAIALAALENQKPYTEQFLARVRGNPYAEQRDSILSAEAKYLKSLKKQREALQREFEMVSAQLSENAGVHLESLLGLSKEEMDTYLDEQMHASIREMTSPWELKGDKYINRATGEKEWSSSLLSVQGWKDRLSKEGLADQVKMFWTSREIGQDWILRKKMGVSTGDNVAGTVLKSAKIAGAGGLLVGAGVGFVARTLWRTLPQFLFHKLDKFASSWTTDVHDIGQDLKKSGPFYMKPIGWLLGMMPKHKPDKYTYPSEKRGDPKVGGPIVRGAKALFQGRGEALLDKDKKKKK